jgi:uncharacterized membrane protein YjdF
MTKTYSWKQPFFAASVILLVLVLINDLAFRLYLYSAYAWLDIPLHFLGGFGVGIATIGLLRMVWGDKKYINSPRLLYTVVLTLFVGIAWELVEVYYNVSVAFGGDFWFDTCKDLLMDTLGGILSYICFHPRKKNIHK